MYCEDCRVWFVNCPCCLESFCPDCGKTETELENEEQTKDFEEEDDKECL